MFVLNPCPRTSVEPVLVSCVSLVFSCRGLSSVVRRCVHRETGKEYAVKFIDKTIDITLAKAVRTEIDALERVSHQYISKRVCVRVCVCVRACVCVCVLSR